MPFLIPMLLGALATAMASLVGRAVIALGIGFVTYKGIDLTVKTLKANVVDTLTGMPGDVVSLIGYLWLDKALSVVFSAVAVSLSMKLVGGSLKKAVLK